MPIKDLPGFYFDHEKNRYFPCKGPVPGRAPKRPAAAEPPPAQGTDPCSTVPLHRTQKINAPELLRTRELHGKVFNFYKQRQSFEQICCNIQASKPVVWKYQNTDDLADSAVCQFSAVIQTPEGQKETSILTLGSMRGSICVREFENVGHYLNCGFNNIPILVWPPTFKDSCIVPASFWGSTDVSKNLPCSVSSIHKIGVPSHSTQNGLITTLGCGGYGGSLYILNLLDPLDFTSNSFNLLRRIRAVATLDCTMWTSVCNPDGKRAAVGTHSGAGLIDLETGKNRWLYHHKSDIFSEQFDNTGNILLCGHRNGSIVSFDIRQRHLGNSDVFRHHPRHSRRSTRKLVASCSSRVTSDISMPSAVCSLVSLTSDDRYFLGSSMDGSIKLFDRCLLGRGSVQSYEGHVNSHYRLQLGVNPSETLVLSGGEDGYVRIWNIKTAKLLFAEKISSSVLNSVCWQQNELDGVKSRRLNGNMHMLEPSWQAWLGSREGVFSIRGT